MTYAKKLPPSVRRLVDPDRDRRADPTTVKLSKTQLTVLESVVRRKRVPTETFSMANAITALAGAERSQRVAKIVGKVLADDSETSLDRSVAAATLRLLPGRTAQKMLLEGLRSQDRQVRLQVIKSLGAFGDADALASLRKLRSKDAALRRQLDFSKALIAHRLGSSEPALTFRRGAKRTPGAKDDMITLKLRPKRKKTVRRDFERLRDSSYGIEVGDRGFGLSAGKARWTLFLNRDIEREGFGRLFERPWITALLARWDRQTHQAEVQYVVLTDPAPRSTEIAVFRTDGELFYSGRMTRTGGLFRFDIRDIERAGTAPTNVRGRLTTRGVELEAVVPFGLRKNARSGGEVVAPLEPSSARTT